jgi:hypothetical protein
MAAALGGAMVAALTACGPAAKSHSGHENGHDATHGPSQAAATSTPAAPGGAGAAVLGTLDQVKQVLPDPRAMGPWDPIDRAATTADGRLSCPSPQQCAGKLFGMVKYRLRGDTALTVTFDLVTFTKALDATGYLRTFSKYRSFPLDKKMGDQSYAYQRYAGGLYGNYIAVRVGTVVATTVVERLGHGVGPINGPSDVTLLQTADMFSKRVRQGLEGKKVDASMREYTE